MPRTIRTEKTVFLFNELSDSAKERARDWLREAQASDTYWSEHIETEFLTEIAPMLGLHISGSNPNNKHDKGLYWSGFSSQGDGAAFAGTWYQSDMKLAKLKEFAPQDAELHRIADELAGVQAEKDQGSYEPGLPSASISVRGYSNGSMTLDSDCVDDDSEEALREALRDLATWFYRALEREYTYQNSAECIDETIEANGYEFSEEGYA